MTPTPATNSGSPSTDDRSTDGGRPTAASRSTENRATGLVESLLRQDKQFASVPGPLMKMMQVAQRLAQGLERTLLVTSLSFAEKARLYNASHFDSKAILVSVVNWDGVLNELAKHDAIGRLALFIESAPGYLLFDSLETGRPLPGVMNMANAAQQFRAMKKRPVIRSLDVEGCNAGADLAAIREFGLSMEAEEVTAINQYHLFDIVRVSGSPRDTDRMEATLRNLGDYIVTPHARGYLELAKTRPVSATFLIEWFSSNFAVASKPLPSDPTARAECYKRSDIREFIVSTPDDLRRIQDATEKEPKPSRVSILLTNQPYIP